MLDAIKNRRSCRNFDPNKTIENEKLMEVINAGLNAPSAKNRQTGIIIAVTNKIVRDKISNFNAKILGVDIDPFYKAPVILLVAVEKAPTAKYDGSIMIENMMLEATNQGLASIWIHRAKEELEDPEFKEILNSVNLDLDNYEGVGHVALGYANDTKYPKKELKEGRAFFVK